MKRVLIIGSPGSGKSTLAIQLSAAAGLPVRHLDQLYWRPKWVEPTRAEWRQQLMDELAKPEWIIDGNYGGTLPLRLESAEIVILLDLPTFLCVFRMMKRVLFYRGRSRPDMAADCPERFDLSFFAYVCTFRSRKRPGLLAALQGFSGQTIILRSSSEISELLRSLPDK
jgi:adenylate kinase family enzyme